MFHDKVPINWRQDSVRLIVRKMARFFIAIPFLIWLMEQTTALLEKNYPSRKALRHLYRWIQGSYMYRGYREGLRENV